MWNPETDFYQFCLPQGRSQLDCQSKPPINIFPSSGFICKLHSSPFCPVEELILEVYFFSLLWLLFARPLLSWHGSGVFLLEVAESLFSQLYVHHPVHSSPSSAQLYPMLLLRFYSSVAVRSLKSEVYRNEGNKNKTDSLTF